MPGHVPASLCRSWCKILQLKECLEAGDRKGMRTGCMVTRESGFLETDKYNFNF